MKTLLPAFLLFLVIHGCSTSSRQDFIVDKDDIMDIINEHGGTQKITINRSEYKTIQFPADFYNPKISAIEKENESEMYSSNTLMENALTQSGDKYIFNIDKMISKDYIIDYDMEHYPEGGQMGARFEIEIK